MLQPLIYDISAPGRVGVNLPDCDVPEADLPSELLRADLPLPEVGELQVVRHFVKLSHLNYSIDKGFYPLGSCTMKYNPKINEDAARLPGFAQLHPLIEETGAQGALYLMYELQQWLGEISGFEAVSLTPAAGAQGEFAGILMIRNYHLDQGEGRRDIILVPNSAHGTNPATVTMAGMRVHELPGKRPRQCRFGFLASGVPGRYARSDRRNDDHDAEYAWALRIDDSRCHRHRARCGRPDVYGRRQYECADGGGQTGRARL